METINVNGKEFSKVDSVLTINILECVQFKGNLYEPKKEESKDWEILSFLNKTHTTAKVLVERHNNGTYAYKNGWDYNGEGSLTLQECLDQPNLEIYSVKRKDGEVFTLGDTITHKTVEFVEGVIDNFYTDGKGIWANFSTTFGNCQNHIDNCVKQPTKQKIFTTVDGKDIYEGDEFWCITQKEIDGSKGEYELMNSYSHCVAGTSLIDLSFPGVKERCFSTKEAAKEHYISTVLFDKPLLSLNEMLTELHKFYTYDFKSSEPFSYVINAAKQKLNS